MRLPPSFTLTHPQRLNAKPSVLLQDPETRQKVVGVDKDNRVLRRAGDREEWAKPDFGRPEEEEEEGIGIKQVLIPVFVGLGFRV